MYKWVRGVLHISVSLVSILSVSYPITTVKTGHPKDWHICRKCLHLDAINWQLISRQRYMSWESSTVLNDCHGNESAANGCTIKSSPAEWRSTDLHWSQTEKTTQQLLSCEHFVLQQKLSSTFPSKRKPCTACKWTYTRVMQARKDKVNIIIYR